MALCCNSPCASAEHTGRDGGEIRTEYETRSQRNLKAFAVFEANWKMRRHVDGVDPDYLRDPSAKALARAHEAREILIKL